MNWVFFCCCWKYTSENIFLKNTLSINILLKNTLSTNILDIWWSVNSRNPIQEHENSVKCQKQMVNTGLQIYLPCLRRRKVEEWRCSWPAQYTKEREGWRWRSKGQGRCVSLRSGSVGVFGQGGAAAALQSSCKDSRAHNAATAAKMPFCGSAQKERRRPAYQLKIRRCHEFIKRVRNLFQEESVAGLGAFKPTHPSCQRLASQAKWSPEGWNSPCKEG